ncbi:hypothetical protein J6590_036061 [Homalodisca vitripennis]|nr:hypothetical protein J6590_036061 [Homalodisca vitripennis]
MEHKVESTHVLFYASMTRHLSSRTPALSPAPAQTGLHVDDRRCHGGRCQPYPYSLTFNDN